MNTLLQSLSKFQEICPPIVRASNNPFFKSKYASFDDIQKHIKPYLIKSGLVVTQANVVIDGLPYVESTVWHIETGNNIKSVFPVVAGKSTAQDYGSAVSYAKRYSLTGLLNLIIADEDDDANIVSGNTLINTTTDSYSSAIRGSAAFTATNYDQTVTRATPPSTPTSELPPLPQDKYDAMVKFITDGKIKEVESAIKKYSLNESQKKLLTAMINQSKAEAITKSVKK
jgi:hypothetical protein